MGSTCHYPDYTALELSSTEMRRRKYFQTLFSISLELHGLSGLRITASISITTTTTAKRAYYDLVVHNSRRWNALRSGSLRRLKFLVFLPGSGYNREPVVHERMQVQVYVAMFPTATSGYVSNYSYKLPCAWPRSISSTMPG